MILDCLDWPGSFTVTTGQRHTKRVQEEGGYEGVSFVLKRVSERQIRRSSQRHVKMLLNWL